VSCCHLFFVQNACQSPHVSYAFIFYHVRRGKYVFAVLTVETIFLQEKSQKLYFARDPLGRRSLLLHRPTSDLPYLLLSSVSTGNNSGYQFEELSIEHIYSIDFNLLTGVYHNVCKTFLISLFLMVDLLADLRWFLSMFELNSTTTGNRQ
jgi:hypothetical protein